MTAHAKDVLRAARVEVLRCQQNVDKGGSRAFWIARLSAGATLLESAATVLRMQVAALGGRPFRPRGGDKVTRG